MSQVAPAQPADARAAAAALPAWLRAARRLRWAVLPAALLLLALGLGELAAWRGLAQQLDDRLLDWPLRRIDAAAAYDDVAWIDIDAAALQHVQGSLGGWPLPRASLALLLGYLRDAGARAIALDIVLADPRPGDDVLARVLDAPGAPVVLAAAGMGAPQPVPGDASAAAVTQWRSLILPQPALRDAAHARVGMVSVALDADNRLRRLSVWHAAPGVAPQPALPLAVWQALEPTPPRVDAARNELVLGARRWPMDALGRLRLPPMRAGQLPRLALDDVAAAALGAGDDTALRRRLSGRVVVLGSSAALDNRVLTPLGQMAGAEWLAAAIAHLDSAALVAPAPPWTAALLALLALAPALVVAGRGGPRARVDVPLHLTAAAAVLALAAAAAVGWRQAWPVSSALGVLGASVLVVATALHRAGVQRARALQREREVAQEASRAKSEFLARMSHELRTPLNGVIGACQLLQAHGADPQRREELLHLLGRSSRHLLDLVDGVLQLGRIEAGALELADEDFHLLDAIESALAAVSTEAHRKGLTLAGIVAPELPPWRRGDAVRLRQVLLNLLGNAVKFTLQGRVVLRVSADDVRGGVLMRLRDTGVGMEPEACARIFEPFRQADRQTERMFGGSGLGLAISARLVQAMGGTLEVTSTPGAGTEFTAWLPLPPAATERPQGPPLALEVVLVEPDADDAAAAAALLERLGCRVHLAPTAARLREVLGEPPQRGPAWLLVTLDDPRALQWLAQSGQAWPAPRALGMRRAGASAAAEPGAAVPVVSKPLFRAALVSRLVAEGAAVPSPEAPRARPVAAQALPDQAPALPVPAAGAARNGRLLVVEDDPVNQLIVGAMLTDAGWQVDVADCGAAALHCLSSQPYRVVLMDWQMPDLDGLEVTRRLRAGAVGDLNRHAPVVALTANAFEQDRAACIAAGMDDFLTKPVVQTELLQVVARRSGGAPPRAGTA